MLTIVQQTPTPGDLADWLATVPGFIQGLTTVDDAPTALYAYQTALMTSPSRFRAALKARQIGMSFSYAAEGLAKAMLQADYTAIYVSYNLADAKEKIRHAAMLYESLPAAYRRRRVTDNKTELEFTDGQGHRSRLVSMPCREPRGKGKADVFLDELPFMRNSRAIYTAAVPLISRGGGALTVGSTPLGKQDLFYEIMEGEAARYPQYDRHWIPWWVCPEFCPDLAAAARAAPGLGTAERVARYGTPTLQALYGALDQESFQQEYECCFIDEAVAFLPWDLITAASRDADTLPVARTVDELAALEIHGPLFAGYDVGRRRHASELLVVERREERLLVRLLQTLERAPFELQHATLATLLTTRPDVARLCIDETGLGMQLAEQMAQAFPQRVEPIGFTAPVKSALAHGLKIPLEGRALQIPAERDLMLQLHSVKKAVTAAGNIRLDTDADEQHHADKFWALALAVHGAAAPPARLATPLVGGARPLLDQYAALQQVVGGRRGRVAP